MHNISIRFAYFVRPNRIPPSNNSTPLSTRIIADFDSTRLLSPANFTVKLLRRYCFSTQLHFPSQQSFPKEKNLLKDLRIFFFFYRVVIPRKSKVATNDRCSQSDMNTFESESFVGKLFFAGVLIERESMLHFWTIVLNFFNLECEYIWEKNVWEIEPYSWTTILDAIYSIFGVRIHLRALHRDWKLFFDNHF